ncbi:transposase family protein [Streptomyces malaysiensis]
MLERLAQVPDPRDPRGVRHPLVTLLALTARAVLAGARPLLAVSEWVADAPPALLGPLPFSASHGQNGRQQTTSKPCPAHSRVVLASGKWNSNAGTVSLSPSRSGSLP